LQTILTQCDILFLQEHWLSDEQLGCLGSVSVEHTALGVIGFGNSDVLSGRPYGGCAIVWRTSLKLSATSVTTNSRRMCTVMFSDGLMKLLCTIYLVYMPYERAGTDTDNTETFQQQLSIIDSLIDLHSDCHVVLGGDLNVDFMRNAAHTGLLSDFCEHASIYSVYAIAH